MAFNPSQFARDVKSEIARVSWPTRKETAVTTALVFAMATIAAIFFFVVDQVIGLAVRGIFNVGV